jgi:hypothetical protein
MIISVKLCFCKIGASIAGFYSVLSGNKIDFTVYLSNARKYGAWCHNGMGAAIVALARQDRRYQVF